MPVFSEKTLNLQNNIFNLILFNELLFYISVFLIYIYFLNYVFSDKAAFYEFYLFKAKNTTKNDEQQQPKLSHTLKSLINKK